MPSTTQIVLFAVVFATLWKFKSWGRRRKARAWQAMSHERRIKVARQNVFGNLIVATAIVGVGVYGIIVGNRLYSVTVLVIGIVFLGFTLRELRRTP